MREPTQPRDPVQGGRCQNGLSPENAYSEIVKPSLVKYVDSIAKLVDVHTGTIEQTLRLLAEKNTADGTMFNGISELLQVQSQRMDLAVERIRELEKEVRELKQTRYN
jgi:hypothetical protein